MTIEDLAPAEPSDASPTEAIAEIFADVSTNRDRAASKVRSFLQAGGNARQLINTARRLIFLKGSNAHDYKFSSALLEDYYKVSPGFRNQFLAAGSTMLRGSSSEDNGLVGRIRAALS